MDFEEVLKQMTHVMGKASLIEANRQLIRKWFKSGIRTVNGLIAKLKKHLGI